MSSLLELSIAEAAAECGISRKELRKRATEHPEHAIWLTTKPDAKYQTIKFTRQDLAELQNCYRVRDAANPNVPPIFSSLKTRNTSRRPTGN